MVSAVNEDVPVSAVICLGYPLKVCAYDHEKLISFSCYV